MVDGSTVAARLFAHIFWKRNSVLSCIEEDRNTRRAMSQEESKEVWTSTLSDKDLSMVIRRETRRTRLSRKRSKVDLVQSAPKKAKVNCQEKDAPPSFVGADDIAVSSEALVVTPQDLSSLLPCRLQRQSPRQEEDVDLRIKTAHLQTRESLAKSLRQREMRTWSIEEVIFMIVQDCPSFEPYAVVFRKGRVDGKKALKCSIDSLRNELGIPSGMTRRIIMTIEFYKAL